jgi:Tfp pilus assembly protein PilF
MLLAVALAPRASSAREPERIARAVSIQGTVEARRAGGSEWTPLQLDDPLSAGDTIRVGPRSRAVLALLDRSVLRLAENTTVTLQPPGPERSGLLDLLRGAVHVLTRGPRSLDIKTELVSVGVRGTEFLVGADPDATTITVFEGAVVAENAQGAVALSGGQSAIAQRGAAPVLRLVARPRDAVRWALHYPAVVEPRPDDPVSRAQALLAVGSVDEAGAELDRALAASPGDARALSLQAVVAVVQNDRDRAQQLARAAVAAAPASATAQLALSYALQARFDLAGARASARRAVTLDPKDALAWARLAELDASFGEAGAALEAARQASALAPDLSRTRTVLGFAHLANVDPRAAERELERAIALDSADPLPRLGLGLARVRTGDLDRGARDLEIAANLAPNDALVRSYLGKAYFEEKRTGLDEREFATAKDLDPKDPTPWFYSAISKQASNRPVEALWDLDRAIELNDGRAVYRSRLLLDSDLAARSASLGRIYGDLGFQQLALAEGWRSLDADPTSDSAHRLLADSYAALPRHEVARVSELLQAQLLQPLNVTPIQPRLGESNLLLAGRGGPGFPAFNEFNPLFERDRLVGQVGWFAGDRSTVGVEPVVAGVYRNVSVSAGYSRFWTDGFRVNADQTDQIGDVFVQAMLSRDTSVQAEYRRRHTDFGSLQSQFLPELVKRDERHHEEYETYRVGARHAFSAGSVVLASAAYQTARGGFTDRLADPNLPAPLGVGVNVDTDAGSGELQWLLRSRWVDVVSGAGFFRIRGRTVMTTTLEFPPPPAGPGPVAGDSASIDPGVRHANAYSYAHLHLGAALTVTAGASADVLKSVQLTDRTQVNPKVGVTWSPFAGTTLRAAAFRVLKRSLIADQTLEPTQVAGFSQFFDDENGARSWRFGLGLDQRFSRGLFGGVEGSRRELVIPLTVNDQQSLGIRETRWSEYEARGYLFWTPRSWVALRAEYAFERLVRDRVVLTDGLHLASTHRVPVGVSLFHRSGLGATATATYVRQAGSFGDPPTFVDGSDRFWLVDAGLSWRLPRRAGTFGVVATNLLDQKFKLYEYGINNWSSTVQPARAVFARVTLATP